MMDFAGAAERLARDQSKLRGRNRSRGGIAISAKARQQAEYQKKQQAKLRAERERKKKDEAHRKHYFHDCQRSLKEKGLGSSGAAELLLKPTSIHGDGDKIALPPSVLETLTSNDFSSNEGGNPWTFRIGIRNPDYAFPASPLIKVLQAPLNDDDDDDMSDDDDEEMAQDKKYEAFLDELGHKYLSFTHCTVVEFTQDEGNIGIPRHIAQALLDPHNRHEANRNSADIPTTLTVDPAAAASAMEENDAMDTTEEITDQTPGHLAWGAFEIPDTPLEIMMVQLPKGTGCTLKPTEEAVKNNFYGLKDIKLVLEQSLVRTRATLSIGDKVSTWHRGKKFELNVTKILPSKFQAVTCINTDIEVEFGETKLKKEEEEKPVPSTNVGKTPNTTTSENSGYRLGSSQPAATQLSPPISDQKEASPVSLLPEPPADQKVGVCTVQIRYSGGHGKRRFAVETAQVKDLFGFASSLVKQNERTFRLVTRFPRRELSLANTSNSMDPESTLAQAGIQQGQEMFLVESL